MCIKCNSTAPRVSAVWHGQIGHEKARIYYIIRNKLPVAQTFVSTSFKIRGWTRKNRTPNWAHQPPHTEGQLINYIKYLLEGGNVGQKEMKE